MSTVDPPGISADGRYRWDGSSWIPTDPLLPWQLLAARVLVFVEAALIGVSGILGAIAIAALGLLVNADNGGAGLPAVGHAIEVVLFVTALAVAAAVLVGVKLARRPWAYWAAAGLQVLLCLLAVWGIAAAAQSPTRGSTTHAAVTVLWILIPIAAMTLLLAPSSRKAVLDRYKPIVDRSTGVL